MSLNIIAELSRLYGADPRFVLAGGGNTSYKDEKNLYIKPSGVALADVADRGRQACGTAFHAYAFKLPADCEA